MEAKDLIGRSLRLRALPKVVLQLQRLLDSGEACSATVAHCLRNDPALSAQVLRIANSSWYHLSAKVNTISRAVTIIGHNAINNLVLASSVVGLIEQKKMPNFDMQAHWEHSLKTAILARLMAEECNVLHSEPFFIGGLLHDIGTMVIVLKLPELSRTLYMRFPEETMSIHDIERQTLGFTHADVGAELLASWSLPNELVEAVRHHHQPTQASDSPLNAAIIQIACAYVQTHGRQQELLERMIDPSSWRITGLEPGQLVDLMSAMEEVFVETFELFFSRAA